ncbi:hypothetical protein Tco_1084707 [Tanacetum coccineum]
MAFIGGSWSDSEKDAEDKTNDETCLMAQLSNEVTLNSSYYSDNVSSLDNDSMQIDYDSLCEISLKIINKNKILKTKRDLLEKEILELNDKIKKLERSKELRLLMHKAILREYVTVCEGQWPSTFVVLFDLAFPSVLSFLKPYYSFPSSMNPGRRCSKWWSGISDRNEMGRGLAPKLVIVGSVSRFKGRLWDCIPRSLFWREDPNRDGERRFDYLTSALVSSKVHREWCRASRGGFPYW